MLDMSPKQAEVWRNTIRQHHRWNVSYGATRSGKTYLDYYKIPWRIRHAGKDGLILLLGNTKGTLERNVLDPLRQIWTEALVGRVGSNNKINLFGREVYALGADKINQVSKLQGAGLSYCYGDEVTTWHPDIFQMLKSRLDKPGACFDGTCNPDNPNHWFRRFLESDADIYSMGFCIDDNPFLLPEFVENLKREYAGTIFYDRFILGRWVAAEGIIYCAFANDSGQFIIDTPPPVAFVTIGLDFGGNASGHAINCTGYEPGFRGIVTLDEDYTKDLMDPEQLNAWVLKFVKKQVEAGYKIVGLWADSAEQVLMRGVRNTLLKNRLPVEVKDSIKGPIVDRVRFYTMLMGAGRYKIMRSCTHTIDAFRSALWKPDTIEDERLDNGTTNIDSLDSQEYSTEYFQKQMLDILLAGR